MAEPAVGANYLLGRGNLFIDRWSGGVKTGKWRFLGNVPKLEFSTEDDVLEKNSSCEAAAPLVLSIVRKRTPKLSISLDEYRVDNIALNLMGAAGTYSQVTGAIVGESLTTTVVNGDYVRTANRRITAVVVKKSPSTVLTLNTDYRIIDAESGVIQLITGGALAAGDAVIVDYTKGTITAESKVSGGVSTVIDCGLLYIPDPANGPKDEVEVWHAQINNDGALPLITEDDTGQFSLTAKVISDAANHSSDPYYIVRRRP